MGLTKEEFAGQVKSALAHIYDVAYLPQLELTNLLPAERDASWDEQARNVRHTLLQAIERLDPHPDLPLRARERRSYAILSACFARSMTTQAVMEELAISERHYWRERRKAIAALVDLLWADHAERIQDDSAYSSLSAERDIAAHEADLMASCSSPECLNLAETVHQALRVLRSLIEAEEAQVRFEAPDMSLFVFADPTVLRQVTLNLLSRALDLDGDVSVRLREQPASVELEFLATMRAEDTPPAAENDVGLTIVQRLVQAQGGYVRVERAQVGSWSAIVGFPKAPSLPVLVIDDNEAIIKLFRRYLAGSRYRVVGAESGSRALQLIRQVRPAAITLDVMMPGQDGWGMLQALKTKPEFHDIPVIVCSILDEPQLAYSLGADGFIRKPVNQTILLQALNRRVSHSSSAASACPAETEDTRTTPSG